MLLAPGFSIHSERFLQWLRKAGCEVYFVDSTRPTNLDSLGATFLSYPSGLPRLASNFFARTTGYVTSSHSAGRSILSAGRSIIRPVDQCLRESQLRRLWLKVRPDIVHLHWVDNRAYDCYKARMRPLVLTCWGSDINQHFMHGSNPAYTERTGRALASGDFVFATSNQVLERCNILAGRCLHSMRLPLGIDLELFHPGFAVESQTWRAELGIPNGARILLSMRAWKREHRHEMILHAFSQTRKSLNIPIFLVFRRHNADDSRYEHEVRVEAEKLGILEYVRWVDSVPYDRMPELYAIADAVVNFPAMDSFPTGFIEAAACGKTVISSRLPSYEGAIPEDVFRLVSPDSVQELAQAMTEVLHEPQREAAARGERAREWARQTGDEKVCIRETMTRYEKLVNR